VGADNLLRFITLFLVAFFSAWFFFFSVEEGLEAGNDLRFTILMTLGCTLNSTSLSLSSIWRIGCSPVLDMTLFSSGSEPPSIWQSKLMPLFSSCFFSLFRRLVSRNTTPVSSSGVSFLLMFWTHFFCDHFLGQLSGRTCKFLNIPRYVRSSGMYSALSSLPHMR